MQYVSHSPIMRATSPFPKLLHSRSSQEYFSSSSDSKDATPSVLGSSLLALVREKDDKKVEEFLIRYPNTDLSYKDQANATALLLAASQGSAELVQILLRQPSIQVNQTCSQSGITPLMAAVLVRRLKIVQILLSHPHIDLHIKTSEGKTALMIAIESGQFHIVREILNHIDVSDLDMKKEIPEEIYVEKLRGFSSQIVQSMHQKIETEYKILEEVIRKYFDWNGIDHTIAETLQEYAHKPKPIRNKRCELIKVSEDCYQLIVFGNHKQVCMKGALKSIKQIQIFVLFDFKKFEIHSINLDVILSQHSRIFSYKNGECFSNLPVEGFDAFVKIPKRANKYPRISYRKMNLGLNLREFICQSISTPFLLNQPLRLDIARGILNEFFLQLSQGLPLFDLKLNNMAIRIKIEDVQLKALISFLDTTDKMLTLHHIPLSFLHKYNLDNTQKLLSHPLTPFVQISVACMSVFFNRNAVYETDSERAKIAVMLEKILEENFNGKEYFDEGKKTLFKEALHYVSAPGRFCKAPPDHHISASAFLSREIDEYIDCYLPQPGEIESPTTDI